MSDHVWTAVVSPLCSCCWQRMWITGYGYVMRRYDPGCFLHRQVPARYGEDAHAGGAGTGSTSLDAGPLF